MEQVKIYTLSGPKGVRYVGKTVQSLKARLFSHKYEKGNNRKCTWLKSLKAKGIEPTMELLELVYEDGWEETEIYWIQQFKDWGFDLVNTQLGGGIDGQQSNKSVQQLDKDTGEIIATFESVIKASLATGIHDSSIGSVCNGNNKSAGGYKWKHTDDKDYVFTPYVKTLINASSVSNSAILLLAISSSDLVSCIAVIL